ncbi:MAG TPA: NAD(P)H-dependent oxidoreductase [Flavobacteriaceae bacterium]|jgi:nitroreductase|nr:NAD(P)H-dependent oxidoreductase [Flavobacteriaceae bacterium]HBS13187.1 NAD(P)H-dependent oxidoreductase [Flavobacteriaceae bacterium]
MNTVDSLQWRYACKKFDKNKIISTEKLSIIKEAFNLTATSFGLQPIKMIIIKNKKLQAELTTHSFNQQQVATASHLMVLCIDKDTTPQNIDASFDREIAIRGTSKEVLADFRKHVQESFASKSIKEKQLASTSQAYIALGNLMTVCALEKIDSCPMEGFISKKYDEILDLESKNLKSVLLLPIGYRADDDFMSKLKKVRKPLSDIVIEL